MKFSNEIHEAYDNYAYRYAVGVPKEKLIEIASVAKGFKDSEKLLEIYAPINSKENLSKFTNNLKVWAELDFTERAYEMDSRVSPYKINTFLKKLDNENREYFINNITPKTLKVLKENTLECRPQIIFHPNTDDNCRPNFKVTLPELIDFLKVVGDESIDNQVKLLTQKYLGEIETAQNLDIFIDKFDAWGSQNLITKYIHSKLEKEPIPDYTDFGFKDDMASLANLNNQKAIKVFFQKEAKKIEDLANLLSVKKNIPHYSKQNERKLNFRIGAGSHDPFTKQANEHFGEIINAWIKTSESKRQDLINNYPDKFNQFGYSGPNPLKYISEQLNLKF